MSCFGLLEALELIDFYLERALVKSCKAGKDLSSYNWNGRSGHGELERGIKEIIGISNDAFLIAKTHSFIKTLKRFGFKKDQPICVDCPRVAVTIEIDVIDGIVRQKRDKTRIGCFLRHIRNSIAHGNTFEFPNGNILFLDFTRDGSISGFILMHSSALLKIEGLIQAGPSPKEKK